MRSKQGGPDWNGSPGNDSFSESHGTNPVTIYARGKLTVAKVAIILKQSGLVKVLTPGENHLLSRAMALEVYGTLSHR